MCNVKLKLPAEGVRLIAVVTALLCCFMALGASVFAASEAQTVELKANGSEARLVMDFPQAAAEEIASMQISLVVSEGSDIEFIPDSGISAKIVESRYHSDTGVLTIYLAGTRALFSASSPLTVGTIRLGGTDASAAVGVVEGSIKFVRGSELVTPSDVVYPDVVTVSTGNAPAPFLPNTSFPGSFGASSPSEPDELNEPKEPNEPNEPAFVPVELADTSSLENAVERAEVYKRGDYTEDSFNTLVEALDKAKAVLSNESSTQDEVDEALLVLENAIGMLTSSHIAPSGTDDYGISDFGDDTSISGSSGGLNGFGNIPSLSPSENGGNELTDSGEITGSEQTDSSQASDTSSSSEKEKSENTVMWIIIVMAVLAAAAAALVAALKLNNKKKKK